MITEFGMKRINAPSLNMPIAMSMKPAIIVQIIRFAQPYLARIAYSTTTNAPVGPPIHSRVPPSAEIKNPAMIAVISPCSGVTPLAIAKAIASGTATMPTVTPASRSARNLVEL